MSWTVTFKIKMVAMPLLYVQKEQENQLQSWNTVGAPPCMERSGAAVPGRIGTYYKTPRPQPWRPTLGYENVEVTPLPTQPVTNAASEPPYAPSGMAMEPLRFPNLVTGVERNPGHAARSALYARFTPFEWIQNSISHFNEADTNRNFSERLRGDAFRIMRESDEKAVAGQREAGRRLGERITDTTFWRNEVSIELEKVIAESNMLQDKRRELEKVIQDCEGPLHIAQECLYQRENRKGIDVVHDQVEQALLYEVENLRNCIDRFKNLHEQTLQQLRNNRALQHELERDQKSKESALGIDNMCHQLNNFSRGVNYYKGIDKYDPTVTVPETWAEHSKGIVERSQNERSKSAQLRVDIDNLINAGANDIWNAWNTTNNSLERRCIETLESKSKLQMHLHKLQQEIFDMEKSMELLRKSLLDKNQYIKVAQTRLEARTHRRDVELCRDNAQVRLVQEVKDIEESMAQLNRKLHEAESQHQQLLKTRSNMEIELQNKVNTLFIDREKCLGMRRSFPITATLKY